MQSEAWIRSITALVLSMTLLGAWVADAEEKTFVIDPNRSEISLSGEIVGADAKEQWPGSLTTRFEGILRVDAAPTSLQFLGGSVVDAQVNGDSEPRPGGAAGKAPADYGAQGSLAIGSGKAAARGIQLDVTSGILPLEAGAFDGSQLVVFFPTNGPSILDYRVTITFPFPTVIADSLELTGYATNKVATGAQLISEGDTETMTIPVEAEYFLTLVTPNDSRLQVTGTIVATHTAAPPLIVDASLSASGDEISLSWPGDEGDMFRVEAPDQWTGWVTVASNLVPVDGVVTWSTSTDELLQFFRVARD